MAPGSERRVKAAISAVVGAADRRGRAAMAVPSLLVGGRPVMGALHAQDTLTPFLPPSPAEGGCARTCPPPPPFPSPLGSRCAGPGRARCPSR